MNLRLRRRRTGRTGSRSRSRARRCAVRCASSCTNDTPSCCARVRRCARVRTSVDRSSVPKMDVAGDGGNGGGALARGRACDDFSEFLARARACPRRA
eukprot:6183784-Pleurochrysis_carterae.AAC.1